MWELVSLPAPSGGNLISGTNGGSEGEIPTEWGLRVGEIPQRRVSTPIGQSRKTRRHVRVPTARYGAGSDTALWIPSG